MLSRAAGGAFHSVILRGPIERAYFDFIRITLLRSRTHKLLLAGWVGIGLAITFALVAASARSVWAGHPTPALLAVQLSLVFLVLCGIRFVFTVPVELSANWAFQVADPRQKWPGAAAMRKALVTLGACPVLFALLPLHTMLWGWRAAAADLLYGLLVSALLAEALLLGFAKVPFTCTYLPGKANLKAFWSAYAAAFWFYTYTLAALEYRALARPLRFGILCAAVLLGTALLRRLGARPFSRNFRFIFEELPEPAVRSMNIGYGATGEARRSTI